MYIVIDPKDLDQNNYYNATVMSGRYERLPLRAQGDQKDEESWTMEGLDCEGAGAALDLPDLPLDNFVLVHVPRGVLSVEAQASVKLPLQVEIFGNATVLDLKRMIASALPSAALPAERQRLAFNGRVLGDDAALLAACGVACGAQIHVFPRAVLRPPPQPPSPPRRPLWSAPS